MEYKPKEEVEAKFKSIIELLKSDASNDVKRDALAGIVEKITYSRVNDSVEIFLFYDYMQTQYGGPYCICI